MSGPSEFGVSEFDMPGSSRGTELGGGAFVEGASRVCIFL